MTGRYDSVSDAIPDPEPLHGAHQTYARGEVSSIGELISDITADLSTLLRREVALAKAEAMQSAGQAGEEQGCSAGRSGRLVRAALLSIALWWALGSWWTTAAGRPSPSPFSGPSSRPSSRPPAATSSSTSRNAAHRGDRREGPRCAQGKRGPVMSSNDPDQLRAEIERTRSDLSQNVNALGEAVTPATSPSARSTRSPARRSARDKVMGTVDDATSSAADTRERCGRPGR